MPIPLLEQVESVEMDSSSAQMVGPKESGGAGARSFFGLLLSCLLLFALPFSGHDVRHPFKKLGGTFRSGGEDASRPRLQVRRGRDIVEAAQYGDLARVEELLRSDPSSVEEVDSDGNGQGLRAPRGSERRGQTALHVAALEGHVDVVRRLLEARAATGREGQGRPEAPGAEELRRKRFVLTSDDAFLRCKS